MTYDVWCKATTCAIWYESQVQKQHWADTGEEKQLLVFWRIVGEVLTFSRRVSAPFAAGTVFTDHKERKRWDLKSIIHHLLASSSVISLPPLQCSSRFGSVPCVFTRRFPPVSVEFHLCSSADALVAFMRHFFRLDAFYHRGNESDGGWRVGGGGEEVRRVIITDGWRRMTALWLTSHGWCGD